MAMPSASRQPPATAATLHIFVFAFFLFCWIPAGRRQKDRLLNPIQPLSQQVMFQEHFQLLNSECAVVILALGKLTILFGPQILIAG